jgi:AcrR family transcriptional regulator
MAVGGDGERALRREPGRPKKTVTAAPQPGLPPQDPLASLPPSAVAILRAARRVVAERGFAGLTIEAVANEANVSRTLVSYHFGNRAGLVELLVDSLFHDLFVASVARRGARAGSLGDLMELLQQEARDREAFRAFFEILPSLLREDELRARVAGLYDLYRELLLQVSGVSGDGAPDDRRLAAVGSVLLALVDGLGLQALLDPAFDPAEACAAAAWLIGDGWGRLAEGAAPSCRDAAADGGTSSA